MSAETETQYNPQYGVRRTDFSDEYDFLTKVGPYVFRRMGLHFAVRTWKDHAVRSVSHFLTPSVFRFVMVPELTAQSHRQPCWNLRLLPSLKANHAKLVETQHCFVYETEQLSLHFEKITGEMSVYQNGRIVDEGTGLRYERR